jgi:hypothetical protein
VVDTGSTDDSVAVADAHDAVVLHRPWDGDFAAPRNLGLDHATGDWILYIDADEHLAPVTRAHVETELADRDGHVAYRLRLRPAHGMTPFWEFRLFRNRPDIRFHGVIHESHLGAIHAVAEQEDLAIGHADLLLEHEGYEGDQTAKHRRNLPLLRAQVVNDPDRPYLWGHLGRVLAAVGDDVEARAAWGEAIAIVRRRGVRVPADCIGHLDLITHDAQRGAPDPELVAEADRLFPENVAIAWAGALDAVARDAHEEVVDRLDRVLATDAETTARQAVSVNVRVLGDWAHHARGMARFHLGDHAGAAEDFAAAERLAPGVAEYGVKRRLAEARIRRPS